MIVLHCLNCDYEYPLRGKGSGLRVECPYCLSHNTERVEYPVGYEPQPYQETPVEARLRKMLRRRSLERSRERLGVEEEIF